MISMSVRGMGVCATLGAAVILAGCHESGERLNSPPQGASERPHEMQDTYVYMHDNAMLAEMSMSPTHFVPNRPDLNALGLRRLMRYAELLKEFGGTLNYDGVDDPEALSKERMERIHAFLAEAGVDPNSFKVGLGLAGGTGMRGTEGSGIRDASTFSQEQQSREQKGAAWAESFTGGKQ